jgi:hypothetical protein
MTNKTDIDATNEPLERQEQASEDLKMGYIVGLTKEGNFVFELVGKDRTLVELLGLHQYAQKRVYSILDEINGSGDRLIKEVGQLINKMAIRLESVVKAVVKPDNKLE